LIKIRLRWEENAVKLAARLCEKLVMRGVMPLLRGSQIILDDSSSNSPLTTSEVLMATLRSLSESGIHFDKYSVRGEEILIEDREPSPHEKRGPKLFICPHCGFVTPYEEEYWVHLKVHYVGF